MTGKKKKTRMAIIRLLEQNAEMQPGLFDVSDTPLKEVIFSDNRVGETKQNQSNENETEEEKS